MIKLHLERHPEDGSFANPLTTQTLRVEYLSPYENLREFYYSQQEIRTAQAFARANTYGGLITQSYNTTLVSSSGIQRSTEWYRNGTGPSSSRKMSFCLVYTMRVDLTIPIVMVARRKAAWSAWIGAVRQCRSTERMIGAERLDYIKRS